MPDEPTDSELLVSNLRNRVAHRYCLVRRDGAASVSTALPPCAVCCVVFEAAARIEELEAELADYRNVVRWGRKKGLFDD